MNNQPTDSPAPLDGWQPIATAPRDGTRIRVLWLGGEDVASWEPFRYPEEVWTSCPWTAGQIGEWNCDLGNGSCDEVDPLGWRPLDAPRAEPADGTTHTDQGAQS